MGGQERSPRRGRKFALALVAAVLVAGAGIGGYLLGDAEAPTAEDASRAEAETRRQTQPAAYREAFSAAERRGLKQGRKRGERAGRREGKEAGQRVLDERQAQAEEQAAVQQSACPPGQELLTQMGVQYCGRPGPARPEDCPPGQVPVGETGACAPADSGASVPPTETPPSDYAECAPGFTYTNEPSGGCVPVE